MPSREGVDRRIGGYHPGERRGPVGLGVGVGASRLSGGRRAPGRRLAGERLGH